MMVMYVARRLMGANMARKMEEAASWERTKGGLIKGELRGERNSERGEELEGLEGSWGIGMIKKVGYSGRREVGEVEKGGGGMKEGAKRIGGVKKW